MIPIQAATQVAFIAHGLFTTQHKCKQSTGRQGLVCPKESKHVQKARINNPKPKRVILQHYLA